MGRDAVVTVLRSTIHSAASQGGGQVLLVTGEAGIGKTVLLAELAESARAIGSLVLWAQCWDGDGAPAYWPWVQVLRAGIAAGGDPGDAAMLLPESESAWQPAIGQADRFRLFDAVATFLGGLAAQRPLLMVVDDLHWADEDSLRLLEFAARHLASQLVSVLGAYRDDEAGDALLRMASKYERVGLQGLSRADIGALMRSLTGTAPPPAVATDVWRRTGGNPFLVRELTRLLVAQGGYREESRTPPEVLDRVRDILERRLARISQPCTELLTVAAVIGQEIRLDVLTRVAADADTVPGLLDEAVNTRVLAEPAAPAWTYRFSHDLFRETILAGLPADRRTQLHLAVGRALEALRDDGASVHAAELGAHFAAAATAVPAEAVRYGTLAAEDATARMAYEEARGHYERALAAVAEPASRERLELLLRLGVARNRAGDAQAAHSALSAAADLARRLDDPQAFARAAIGIHELGWRHDYGEAIAMLEHAAETLPERPSVLRARVFAALSRDLYHSIDELRDWERARLLATEAVEDARFTHDHGTLAFCLLALHDVSWHPGTAHDRLPVIDEMLAAADAAGDRDMAAQARLLRATALLELGSPEGPSELDAYCRQCDELGHARARYGAVTRRATAALIAGDLARAEELAANGLALGEAIGEPDKRGVYETLLWGIKRVGGSPKRCDLAPEGAVDAEPWPGLPLLAAIDQVWSGDLAAAGRTINRLNMADLPRTYDLELLTFVVDVVAAAGTDEQRRRAYKLLLPHAGSHIVVGGCASYYGAADHYLGLLARSLGRTEDARRHLDTATEMHTRLGAPVWTERSRGLSVASRSDVSEQVCFLRRDGDVWTIAYDGTQSLLPDVKGLRDLEVLLQRPGEPVHCTHLYAGRTPQTGADEILDDRAKAAYRNRLAELESDLDDAELNQDTFRAEQARAERDALIAELSAAVGLGGRDRRLGDERERARKAVTARIRDAIGRIERANPALGEHLRTTVRTGLWCTYSPNDSIHWSRQS